MKMKRMVAILAATMLVASLTAFAEEATTEDVMLIAENPETEVAEEATEETTDATEEVAGEVVIEEVEETVAYPENAMVVNGTDTGKTVVTKEEVKYVPVRAMCEAMGMEVQWDGENEMVTIVDLPLYITFSPYKDGFTFARTAPMMLGTDPFLTEGTTYVPLDFITEILHASYSFADNGAIIIDRIIDKSVVVKVIAKTEEEGNTVLTVEDTERGEVVVVLAPETVIENEQGEAVTADAIAVDAEIRVEYSDVMTMSIPPMTNAVKIVVADAVVEEVVEETAEEVTEEVVEEAAEETTEK